MEKQISLTQGNVWKVLLRFSVPFVAANLIQALYGAVDLLVVGRYCGPESVAAVSTGTQVTQIITSLITGLTLGSTVLVGKYTGMGDKEAVKKVIGTSMSAFAAVSAVMTAAMLLSASPILKLLHTPIQSFQEAKRYVTICSSGIVFVCGYNVVSAILRGCGDSKRPMLFILLSCILNILGDVLLVKYAGLGVAGVAAATILSQGVSMCCAMWYLNRSGFLFEFRVKNFRVDKEKAKELAAVGIPVSLQECMVRISFLYLTGVTNGLGVFAAAAVGIAGKYDVFAMLPAASMANALAAVTAQNYGAGKRRRAVVSLLAGTGFALLAAGMFWLWAQFSPQTMLGVFTQEPEIVRAGIPFFRSCSYDYLAVSLVFCLNGYLNGKSNTVFTMVSCCFGALALRIPLVYLAFRYCGGSLGVLGMIAPAVSGIMAVYTIAYVCRQLKKEAAQK